MRLVEAVEALSKKVATQRGLKVSAVSARAGAGAGAGAGVCVDMSACVCG